MNYNKEHKKIINKQKSKYLEIRKQQDRTLLDQNLFFNLKKTEYSIYKGENICQIETKS